jgi:hypothetical protein
MPAQHQAGILTIIHGIERTRECASSQADQAAHPKDKDGQHAKPCHQGRARNK